MTVAVGQQAPGFTLKNQDGAEVSLSDFAGKQAVLLVFFPFAFSGICTAELCSARDDIGAFQNDDVQILGISCDTTWSLKVWAQQEAYDFPLLSDFWPHGAVAKAYGVFVESYGSAKRASFLVDPDGIVRWSVINEIGQARDLAGYHQALAAR